MNPIGKKIMEIVIKTAIMVFCLWIFISAEWMDLWIIPSETEGVTAFSLWWITSGMEGIAWILTILYGVGFIALIQVIYWAITKLVGAFLPNFNE